MQCFTKRLQSTQIVFFLITSLILGFAVLASATDTQIIPIAKEQIVQKKTPASLSFDLPAVPAGQQVRLSFLARVQYSSPCANNRALTMTVNGRKIIGANLLNKSLDYNDKNGREVFWASAQDDSWYLFSWPDFSVKDVWAYENPYTVMTGVDPFTFVLDITSYVKPGKNTISFTHNEITSEAHYVMLQDVQVEVGAPIESKAQIAITPAPTGEVPTYLTKGRQPVAMKVELGSGGSIRLKVGNRSFDISSRTSEPAGKWMETTADKWQAVRRDKPARVQWNCQGYQVTREVILRSDHLKINDTFTNTTDKLVGVMLENRLAFKDTPLEVKLSGRPPFGQYQQEGGGANPTSLARWDDMSVGLVAEDDIFRSHAKEFARENAIGLADHELGMDPGASHTLEWSIYPIPKGDYWDFINAVRRNWGSNFTIPGPHTFVGWSYGSSSDTFYQKWLTTRGAKMVAPFDAMFDDGKAAMGTAIPLAKNFCDRTRIWMKKVHKIAPEVKTLFYMNCTLCTEPDAKEKYADSRLLDGNGNQATMAAGSLDGSVVMAPLFISTLDNSYGKAMMETCKWIANDIGADGLYHDVFFSNGYGSRALNTTWDGCTVSIDPNTHAVTTKMSSLAILQGPWHVALVKFLRDNNKVIIGNSAAETRTLLNLKIPLFVETCMSFDAVLDTHLGSPWAYANHPVPHPEKDMYYAYGYQLRRVLNYGGILAIPSWGEEPKELTFLQLMYPFTPIEIRTGIIFGEERIITNRSGRFGWLDNSSADAYVFDGDGKLVSNPQVKEIRERNKVLTEVRMPGDHFAILVKKK